MGYRGIQGIQRDTGDTEGCREIQEYRGILWIQIDTGDTEEYRGYKGIPRIQGIQRDTGDTGKTFLVVAHSKRQYSINLREK